MLRRIQVVQRNYAFFTIDFHDPRPDRRTYVTFEHCDDAKQVQ